MSSNPAPGLRTFAFGDLEAAAWGAGLITDASESSFTCLGGGGRSAAFSASLGGAGPEDEWRLVSPAGELVFEAASDAVDVGDDQAGGFDQLCHVRGNMTVDGAEQRVDTLGYRGARRQPPKLADLQSLRAVSAWFAHDEGVALLALRARQAKGHGGDLITAALFEPGAPVAVADPRLSTTYGPAGRPIRTGLELWLEEEDGEEQYPRRLAGEATGAGVESGSSRWWGSAALLRCHSRGKEGSGVYLLLRQR